MKLKFTIFCLFLALSNYAQTPRLSMTLKNGSSLNRFDIYIKAIDVLNAASISTCNYTILLSTTGITTPPVLTFTPVSSPSFNIGNWDVLNDLDGNSIQDVEIVNGQDYFVWLINGTALNASLTMSINSEIKIGTMTFANGLPATLLTTPRVAHLLGGGSSTIYELYMNIAAAPPVGGDALNHNSRVYGTTSGVDFENNSSPGYYWASVSNVTLPIKLTNFTATTTNCSIANLKWQTTQETNNKGFEVERSVDGQYFTNIGFVNGVGNNSTIKTYSFTANNLTQGLNYFRLKQIDLDGRFEYSPIVKVNNSCVGEISIFPNPAKDFITILGLDRNAKNNIKIYDNKGALVISLVNFNDNKINISNLSNGAYLLRINEIDNYKFVKQ